MSEVKSQFLWIPGPLPGLNEIIDAAHRVYGSGKARSSEYRKMKRSWGERIEAHARAQRFQPVESGSFAYLCVEPARNRDPSNFTAGAMKLIEDGLQSAKLLRNDGWKNVLALEVHWTTMAGVSGVLLGVTPCSSSLVLPPPTRAELIGMVPDPARSLRRST